MKVETTPGEEERMWFVGIDVSKATLDAAALSDDGEIDRLTVKNTGQGHAALVRWLLRCESPVVAMEATVDGHVILPMGGQMIPH